MDPREIENPIAEEDFRHQAKMERFIKTCPETIYLCLGNDIGEQFTEHDEVTWCSEKVNDTDVAYVRKDAAELYAQTKAVEPQEGWVDVKDKLPETFERIGGYYVLVYGRGNLCYGDVVWVENNHFKSHDGDVTNLVTHWMSLPEPPTQTNN